MGAIEHQEGCIVVNTVWYVVYLGSNICLFWCLNLNSYRISDIQVYLIQGGDIHNMTYSLSLVNFTGKPWVFWLYPYPYLSTTHTRCSGIGSLRGQIYLTLGTPVPVPVMGNPRVHNKIA
jgi:hypothetical protein